MKNKIYKKEKALGGNYIYFSFYSFFKTDLYTVDLKQAHSLQSYRNLSHSSD